MSRTLEFLSLLYASGALLCDEVLCPKEWVSSTQRGDFFCDLTCMNGPCGYDGAENSFATSDCKASQACSGLEEADGTCRDRYSSAECGWDLGDCGYCAEGCERHVGFQADLSDGTCDEVCNTPMCHFDGGDCSSTTQSDCAFGCFATLLGNGICEAECFTEKCQYDHGDCESCAPGCSLGLIGNGECNEMCNVAECDDDGGDCDCAPGCHSFDLSNEVCDAACAFASCGFDSHLCVLLTQGDCEVECFRWMIGDGHCDAACNTEACEWDKLDCGCAPGCDYDDTPACRLECFKPECNYDLSVEQLQTLTCEDAMKSPYYIKYYAKVPCSGEDRMILMNCCEGCCSWRPSEVNPQVCVADPDTSSAATPFVVYVAPKASTSADGSESDPYTITAAFNTLYHAYTTFLLLPGEHLLYINDYFLETSHLLKQITPPIKKLVITTHCLASVTDCVRATLSYVDLILCFNFRTIASVDISHVDFYSPLYSDAWGSASTYDIALFKVVTNNELVFTHVTFRHFQGVLSTVILAEGGSLVLTDVDFEEITPYENWPSHIEVVSAKSGATVKYSGGTVKLLNSGFRYSPVTHLVIFLLSEYATITVTNVTFSHNFAEVANQDEPAYNLLRLASCRQCSFRHCVFRNNIANSIVHYQGDLQFGNYTEDAQRLVSDSIEFIDCEFANNTATFGTLTLYGAMHLPDLTIRNCTFTNELSASYGIVAIEAPERTFGSADTWKLQGQVRVDLPAAAATLDNLRFLNCTVTLYGLIAITNFPRVLLSSIEIDSRGAFLGADRYSNTWRDFQILGGAIPSKIPPIPTANCSSLLTFAAVRNLTITALRSTEAKCTIRIQASGDLLTVSRSTFSSDSSSGGSLLLLQVSQSVSILSTTFAQVKSAAGTITLVEGRLLLSACSFQNNEKALVVQSSDSVTLEHSGFVQGHANAVTLYLARDKVRLTVRNCIFDSNGVSSGSIPFAVLASQNNAKVALLITETQFLNNQVTQSSALLLLQRVNFTDDSEISSCEFRNNNPGTVYIISGTGQLRIRDSIFTSNVGDVLSIECSEPCLMYLTSLTFASVIGVSVTLRSSSAIGANLRFNTNQGVCLQLTSSELSASSLSFKGNTAVAGAALSLFSSRVRLTDSTFHSSSATTYGGAVLAEAGSEFRCTDCVFERLSAVLGGAIFAKHESVVSVSRARFAGNSARDGFAILVTSSYLPSSIDNSEIEGNFGEGLGVVSLMNAALVLASSTLRNNTSPRYTAGLLVQLSSLSISRSEFSSQRSASGGFLYASDSEVRVEHSRFSEGVAAASGSAVFAMNTALYAVNCTFRRLTAAAGGAVTLQSSLNTTLSDCQFLDIETQSSESGAIEASESSLQVFKSRFQSLQGTAISGEAASLTVAFSVFADSEKSSSGGGIACAECSEVVITSSLFTGLRADVGSAVYLHSKSLAYSQITDCEFSNNTAGFAGTIWLKGVRATVSNSRFSSNSVGSFGGGLALFEALSLLHNNSFVHNTAQQGAAVYWQGLQPTVTSNACEGNVALYGECLGSFAVALKLEDNSTLAALPSGQVSPGGVSLLLVDHYGETVASDSSSDGWLMSGSSEANLTGATHAKAVKGRFLFNDFTLVAKPKSTVTLYVETSATRSYRLEFLAELRDCERGETQSGLLCEVCEAGTYSLDPSRPCKKCPTEAICLGNFTFTPRPGYWRKDEYTDHFFLCPNRHSCLGSPGPQPSLTGVCEEGYEGNMCQSCSVGYYRWGKVSCAKCPSAGVQVAVRLSICTAVAMLAIMITRSALQERGLHSTYAKVYVDYLQLVMLLGSFHLQWPYIMLRLFNAQESIGAFLEIAFSLRCLKTDETESDTYFHELILFSLLPLFLVGLSCGVWTLTSLCRPVAHFRLKLLGSSTVLYFLAYPSVIRVMASAWTLEEIGAGELWVAGQQQRAFTFLHLKYAAALALPTGLLYGVLIPFALAALLRFNRQTNTWQLGFLTQGYRPDMYYWEVVTVLRLALVVLCVPLFSRVSPAFQVLSALAVLYASLALHRSCRPFADDAFNTLESRALVIVIVTLYAGLFFFAGELSAIAEVALSVFIIGANVYFMVRCWRKSAKTLMLTVAKALSKHLKKTRNSRQPSDN